MPPQDKEIVDIVDLDCNILYSIPKTEAHEKGLLHKCVIAEVVDSQGRFMLIQPNTHKQDSGQFVSPVGGHVSAGEVDEDALKREVKEEIGIENFKYKFIGRKIFNRKILSRHENHYFLLYEIYSDDEPVLSDEAVHFKYFTKEELKELLKPDNKSCGAAYRFIAEHFYPELCS